MGALRGDLGLLGVISLLLVAQGIPGSQAGRVKRQIQTTGNCQVGQYLDQINRVCYPVPVVCPLDSTTDFIQGCRCPFGQVYNGATGQCQNISLQNNQPSRCPVGQYFDTINNVCYVLPVFCPTGAQNDQFLGCRCPSGLTYNGANGRCQTNQLTRNCQTGQFFDTINNACYPLPPSCPFNSQIDNTVGCRCNNGQMYNGLTRQCQTNPVARNCQAGQFFDQINNACYALPRSCPFNSQIDNSVGCRCNNGQMYNGLARQCQTNQLARNCQTGQYFDTINNACYTLPRSCPFNSQIDNTVGCRCSNGQMYNGLARQCQTNQLARNCQTGQYFDTINNACYTLPRSCPFNSQIDNTVGCRCSNGQMYNGLARQCQRNCQTGQYFDTINNACYTLPRSCPFNSQIDNTVGCRCNNGQMYNGLTRQCQTNQARNCQTGYYFDTINNACYPLAQTCPPNSQIDNTVGCRCNNGQIFNSFTRQCQTNGPVCLTGRYFDAINKICYSLPRSCPFNSQIDNTVGCRCNNGQMYNGLTRQCQMNNVQPPTNTCLFGQFYDMINRVCTNLPGSCPVGAQVDNIMGCRCFQGQSYNGQTRLCQTFNNRRNCQLGQYYDMINKACYALPISCPFNSQFDNSMGCRCLSPGQTYNGATRQCQNYNGQMMTCQNGQYYDKINKVCYALPISCPFNSQLDNTMGCRCLSPGQTYNSATRQCQNYNMPSMTCQPGQYFDKINNVCYALPVRCPFNSQLDNTMGCRCLSPGQTYNGATQQCQTINIPRCLVGQYFDKINNVCYQLPVSCPFRSLVDAMMGCRCETPGQIYNGVTGQCQIYNQGRNCPVGQFFDKVNNMCFNMPLSCPIGSQRDSTVGCRCQTPGQSYNGATRQCQISNNQPIACRLGQYFDKINNVCYLTPRTCPFGSQIDNTVGCRCNNGQIYNGATGQCQNFNQRGSCPVGQYFDTVNNVCYPLPVSCPFGSQADSKVGCRCQTAGQTYNGATQQCQNFNQPTSCFAGQYFDVINNICYAVPVNCPFGSLVDNTVGCRCLTAGQTYNGATRQCQTFNQQQTCSPGQYFDRVNNVCYALPISCPFNSQLDNTVGCRCQTPGQTYNGVTRQCEISNQTCANGQFFDTLNNVCYPLPTNCPLGSQLDFTNGCRCPFGQIYNGAVRLCQNRNTQGSNCPFGQYFDTINNVCYPLPSSCPTNSFVDNTLGCRCQTTGQTYNGATQQCQGSTATSTCPTGQFFDTINNGCYNNPTFCPLTATVDTVLGCRCQTNQVYNSVTGRCQNRATSTCGTGQFFDSINNRCTPLPLSSQCPAGAPYDQNLGCRCPNGQRYNGVSRTCQTPPCPANSVRVGSLCQCTLTTQAYDVQRNTCAQRFPCPSGAIQNPILGCVCSNLQLIYDNMSNQCAAPRNN